MLRKSVIAIFFIALMSFSFSGCSAMNTAIQKRNLDVQTKMSSTVFLDPVSPDKKVIYFDMRNTSDKQLNVAKTIANEFRAKGYKITNDPKKATFMLQANILKVGKSDLREAHAMMNSGYGAALTGGALGAATSYSLGGGGRTSAAVGLAGAALSFVGNALVKDTVYIMVTDLQIRERPLDGEVVTQTQQAALAEGSSTKVQQDIKGGKVNWKTYRTRIISTAEKMNLKFDEARPALEKGLARSIGGVF